MKIAFDVQGTLEGPKGEQVLYIFNLLKQQGHELFVWTNGMIFPNELKNDAIFITKIAKIDCDNEEMFMDLAIEDDRYQTYLAAKAFMFVDEIPEKFEDIKEFLKKYIK
jgi:hypothetical protein